MVSHQGFILSPYDKDVFVNPLLVSLLFSFMLIT